MSFFGAAQEFRGKNPHSLKYVIHILQWSNCYSYILPKENTKNIWMKWHIPWVLPTAAFFQRKSVIFVISKNTGIDHILIHNFSYFLESLKVVSVNTVLNLMMSAKMMPSKVFLKYRYFEIKVMAFLFMTLPKKVMKWLKLYCRCDHLTKVW